MRWNSARREAIVRAIRLARTRRIAFPDSLHNAASAPAAGADALGRRHHRTLPHADRNAYH